MVVAAPFWRNPTTQVSSGSPYGKKPVLWSFAEPLADFFHGRKQEQAPIPPSNLADAINGQKLRYEDVALIVMNAVLPVAAKGWKGHDSKSSELKLVLQIGRDFSDQLKFAELRAEPKKKRTRAEITRDKIRRAHAKQLVDFIVFPKKRKGRQRRLDYLRPDLDPRELATLGDWALQCAMKLNMFDCTAGFPVLLPRWKKLLDKMLAETPSPFRGPLKTQPPPWTAWEKHYSGIQRPQTFVRRSPELEPIFRHTFASYAPFAHAEGVSALANVALTINPKVLGLAEHFADYIIAAQKQPDDKATRTAIESHVKSAKDLTSSPFYLDYACDFRGRAYPTADFSYLGPDHMRAMIQFANGEPVDADGADGMRWLTIHVANCEGSTDKLPFDDRITWVNKNHELIREIKERPIEMRDHWWGRKTRFQYVAACDAIVRAWDDPGYACRLPVSFDGTANGIQHLSLLSRDAKAARLVNLVKLDKPNDIYEIVADATREVLTENKDKPWAEKWLDVFSAIGPKKVRTLLKPPILTLPYGAGDKRRIKQICEGYGELNLPWLKDLWNGADYLAEQVYGAASRLMPGAIAIMEYLMRLAKYRIDHGCGDEQFLRWTGPTGFPVLNLYHREFMETIYLFRERKQIRHEALFDDPTENNLSKMMTSAAANFVHSLDSAHLMLVARAAEHKEIEMLSAHDCFACLPSKAGIVHHLTRRELARMYMSNNFITNLRHSNAFRVRDLVPPPMGDFEAQEVENAEYPWM